LSLQIKSLVKTVEVQKYRNRNQHALHDDVLRNEHDIQKALLDIAKGIVKETEEYFESHPATASSVPVARSGRKRRRLISIAPIAENVESSLSSLPSDNSSSQSRNESSATQLSSTQQSSLSYNLSVGRDEADNSVEHPNADDEEAQPQSIEATNYTSVRPVGYNLDIDNLDTAEAISGYINEQSITVLVVPEFDNNLISLNFAAAQDLHVPPLREGDETNWLDFGNGIKEPIVGVVALRWKQSDRPGSPGFTVWCSVCRHNFRGVVFGRPFIQKRLGYSNSQL
jgi:hypothetical protein